MTTSHRDLAQLDPWRRSIERSLHRRAITPAIRRSLARRRRASVALSTLMVAGPTGSLLAATGFGSGGRGVDVAQASPASRAIDNGATPAAMAFELGSRGDAVAEIQRQLGVPADGFFGPVTHAAVTGFQARSGLDVDGIVGPVTWTALFGLEQAAAAAGARDGSVAVILRERTAGDSPDAPDTSANASDQPASDPVVAPHAKPVSTPAPANGACGPRRLSSPVEGTVTSGFGPRGGRNHDGLDVAAPTGTPIRAAECGIVGFAGVQSGYGNMVCVKHSSRFETCYAHMTNNAVAQGQRVQQGQVVGYVGCTGNCTGPHLHFETRVDGSARDPRPYLAGGNVPGAPTVKAAVDSKTKAVAAAAIAKGVERARFAKVASAASQPQATTAWSPAESQQTVASTGVPANTVPAEPAPAAPTYDAPQPTYSAPEPAYEAPPTTHTAPPTPETTAVPTSETVPPPAPESAYTPTPTTPETTAPVPPPTEEAAPITPTPTATAPPVEAPPVEAPPAPEPGPIPTPPVEPAPTPEPIPPTTP